MGSSIFLRRIVVLVALALLIAGMLSIGIFNIVMRHTYKEIQTDELLPIAHTIAGLAAQSEQTKVPLDMDRLQSHNFMDARLHMFDASGEPVLPDADPRAEPPRSPPPDAESEHMRNLLARVLAGQEILLPETRIDDVGFLAVGVPILADNGRVIGAVMFTKPISDLQKSFKRFSLAVLLSMGLAFCVMLLPVYFIARRLTLPLTQMRDISRRMAGGDFSRYADESPKGEIGELAAAMNHFAAESQKLEKTRQDYVANVSHELKTPIAAIRVMSETLSDGMIGDEGKKRQYYALILNETLGLSRLIDDLLELSRFRTGEMSFAKERFNLRELLENCRESFALVAQNAGISLHPVAISDAVGAAYSVPDRIRQVLRILLDNAVKHAPVGGRIEIRAAARGRRIEVSVCDDGDGIPREDLPHIFERFYKVDKSHASAGHGLGLSIAREVLTLLGESITAESEPGVRTVFTFTVERA